MKNHKTVPSVTFFFTRRTSLRFIVVYFGYFIWLFSIEGFFSSKKMFLGTFLLLGRAVIAFQIFKRIMKLYTFNQTRKNTLQYIKLYYISELRRYTIFCGHKKCGSPIHWVTALWFGSDASLLPQPNINLKLFFANPWNTSFYDNLQFIDHFSQYTNDLAEHIL